MILRVCNLHTLILYYYNKNVTLFSVCFINKVYLCNMN